MRFAERDVCDAAVKCLQTGLASFARTGGSEAYLGVNNAPHQSIDVDIFDDMTVDGQGSRRSSSQNMSCPRGAVAEPRVHAALNSPFDECLPERAVWSLHLMDPLQSLSSTDTLQIVSKDHKGSQRKVSRWHVCRIPLCILLISAIVKVGTRPHSKAPIGMLATVYPVHESLALIGRKALIQGSQKI